VHSADGTLPFIHPIVERYRPWFDLFWIRGDAAFASPDIYEYCEGKRITYFVRLRANAKLYDEVSPHMARPVGARPGAGVRSRWSISITKQRAGRGPAGWSVRWNGVRIN
jgi:hypothetical protein